LLLETYLQSAHVKPEFTFEKHCPYVIIEKFIVFDIEKYNTVRGLIYFKSKTLEKRRYLARVLYELM